MDYVMQSVRAAYLIETPIEVRKAAELLASEQSIGSFAKVPGETDAIIDKFGARVEQVTILDQDKTWSLPTSLPFATHTPLSTRAIVTIAFPVEDFAPNIASLFAILLGNLFELQELTGIRLLDVDLPEDFRAQFLRPAFGVEGTRRLASVPRGPLIGTIVKPKLGLAPAEIGKLVSELGMAGVDFIKDDECMTSPPSAPFSERLTHVCRALEEVADATGRKPIYAFNITDDADTMAKNHDLVAEAGGTCVMVSINACGSSAVTTLRRRASLPIHAHRAGWGMLTRHPALGMDFKAYQKLWRLAGIDHLHIGGLQSKFFEEDSSVLTSARDCLTPLGNHSPIMPVISSGQWGGQAPATYEGIQSDDVIYLAGGGILAHPGGLAEGVTAIRQAWDAAQRSIPLDEHARTHRPLAEAIRAFGSIRQERAAAQ
jgi:ribulose-bisphosphate carboxylase large chain